MFIENLNPAKLEKHGLGLDALRERFPAPRDLRAVRDSGSTAPTPALPGYDLIAQARSGMMSVTGDDGVPQRVSTALSDVAAGTVAAFAIAAALVRQQTHGSGEIIDVVAPRGRPRLHVTADRQLPRGRPGAAPVRRHRLGGRDLPDVPDERPPDRRRRRQRPALAARLRGAGPGRRWPTSPTWPPTPGAARVATRSSTPSRRCSTDDDRGRGAQGACRTSGVPCSLINSLSEVVERPAGAWLARRSSSRSTRVAGDFRGVARPWRLGSETDVGQPRLPAPAAGRARARDPRGCRIRRRSGSHDLVEAGVVWLP